MESIIIAVIAIIFSLVQSRMNKDEKEQPTSTKPIQQEIPQTMRVEPVEKQVQVREITPPKKEEPKRVDFEEKKKEAERKIQELERQRKAAERRASMIRSNSKNKSEKSKVAVQVEISKENVLQGVIFSEILGPPKSKKLLNRR